MGRILPFLALGAMSAVAKADTFTLSIGDIGQYSASLVRPPPRVNHNRRLILLQAVTPTLTGSSVLFTAAASPKDGVDVVLSEELRSNIQKAVDSNCKNIDTQCTESIKSLLINQDTRLESRQADKAVVAGAALFGLLSFVIAMLRKGDNQPAVPGVLHVPAAQMAPAASAARAATIAAITKSGAPIVTLTPKPAAPTVTGSVSYKSIR
jgi:hypothetical protein